MCKDTIKNPTINQVVKQREKLRIWMSPYTGLCIVSLDLSFAFIHAIKVKKSLLFTAIEHRQFYVWIHNEKFEMSLIKNVGNKAIGQNVGCCTVMSPTVHVT